MSDNYRFDMTDDTEQGLRIALDWAFENHRHFPKKATGYKIQRAETIRSGYKPEPEKGDVDRLIFYWAADTEPTAQIFPFKMNSEGALAFVKSWLAEVEYGPEPDHDGDNKKGYRVYNEAWGHVDNSWAAFVAIEPEWSMYGK